jgi:acyl carrier protein
VSIRLTILSQIENVAAEQKKKIAPLRDDLILAESGLDSLCFAILVARLEDELGADPP